MGPHVYKPLYIPADFQNRVWGQLVGKNVLFPLPNLQSLHQAARELIGNAECPKLFNGCPSTPLRPCFPEVFQAILECFRTGNGGISIIVVEHDLHHSSHIISTLFRPLRDAQGLVHIFWIQTPIPQGTAHHNSSSQKNRKLFLSVPS